MTFSLRRKRQTILRAAQASLALKITSAFIALAIFTASASAQAQPKFMMIPPPPKINNNNVVTPAFVPSSPPGRVSVSTSVQLEQEGKRRLACSRLDRVSERWSGRAPASSIRFGVST